MVSQATYIPKACSVSGSRQYQKPNTQTTNLATELAYKVLIIDKFFSSKLDLNRIAGVETYLQSQQ